MRRVHWLGAATAATLLLFSGAGDALATTLGPAMRALPAATRQYSGTTSQKKAIGLAANQTQVALAFGWTARCSNNRAIQGGTRGGAALHHGTFNLSGKSYTTKVQGGGTARVTAQRLVGNAGAHSSTGSFQLRAVIHQSGHTFTCNSGRQTWRARRT
jgi:hypothetical protein